MGERESMTNEELQAIEQRLCAATPGPWTTEKPKANDDGWADAVVIAATYGGQGIFAKSGTPARTKPTGRVYATPPGGQMPAADQEFIAHAREDVEVLVAEVKRLTASHQILATVEAFAADRGSHSEAGAHIAAFLRGECMHWRHEDSPACELCGDGAA